MTAPTTAPASWCARSIPRSSCCGQARGGVSSARNRGILAARTEWVALLDSDDAWLPDKLYRQAEMLRRHPDSLLCHTDEIWIRNGRRVNPGRRHAKPAGAIFAHCLPLCCVSPSAVVIHRSVFEAVGLFDPALPACEDYDLWLRIFCRYPIELVPDKLVIKYGGHADQLSRRFAAMDRFRVRALAGLLQSQVLGEREQQMTQQMLMKKMPDSGAWRTQARTTRAGRAIPTNAAGRAGRRGGAVMRVLQFIYRPRRRSAADYSGPAPAAGADGRRAWAALFSGRGGEPVDLRSGRGGGTTGGAGADAAAAGAGQRDLVQFWRGRQR